MEQLVERNLCGGRHVDVIDAGFEPDLTLGWMTMEPKGIAWRVYVLPYGQCVATQVTWAFTKRGALRAIRRWQRRHPVHWETADAMTRQGCPS